MKAVCKASSFVRPRSGKMKSPDNARAEGFFGALKQEFFYARSWKDASKESFARALDERIVWYRDEEIKKAPDPASSSHRTELGIATKN